MAVTYPVLLPDAPQRNGFNQKQQNNTIRSSVDVGEAKVRRRYTVPLKDEKWSMILDPVQLPIFQDWFDTDLQSGVLRFSFADPLTDITKEYRFKDMPAFTPYGTCGSYTVSFNVEQMA